MNQERPQSTLADVTPEAFPYVVGMRRAGGVDDWLPWDPLWTIAVVEAVRMLALPYRLTGEELGFRTEQDQLAALTLATQRHVAAMERYRRQLRGFRSRKQETVNRKPLAVNLIQ